MKKLYVAVTVVAMICASILPGAVAFASPANPPAGSFVNAGSVPLGSKLILNVTYKVTNDEDSAEWGGYWALDDFNKGLQVWAVPDGSYWVVAKYDGKWQTFAGVETPGSGSRTGYAKYQGDDGQGTLQGGYVSPFNFVGAFNPDSLKTNGYIGSFDFGGTKADILTGGTGGTPVDVLAKYFPGYTDLTQPQWGWTYHYRGQTWNNFYNGNTGDIVIP